MIGIPKEKNEENGGQVVSEVQQLRFLSELKKFRSPQIYSRFLMLSMLNNDKFRPGHQRKRDY